ncbi:MarR family transcriptional regulator [Paenibacillus sp. PL2-23]|uniref:MarR family winged helix-turn-helix transcriptional regulator n=1 Tax=Paenibacillus sp. PL2-23 TaxID=2100729 RepID=UPI0030F8FACD
METLAGRFQQSVTQLNRMFASIIIEQLDTPVTMTQLFMLHWIRTSGKCRLTMLADKLEVKPSAVTVMIDRLEKAELVRRIHDESDRRVILVELTEHGQLLIQRAKEIREEMIGAYLSQLDEGEARIVTEVLEKMVRSMQQAPTHPQPYNKNT